MKRIICLLSSVLLFSITIMAQTTDHLKFKGIPIDGNINEFVAQVAKNGLSIAYNNTENGFVVLEGKFAGLDCRGWVRCSPQSLIVHLVALYGPKETSWSTIKSEYEKYKKLYTKKYGTPKSYEYFSDPYFDGDSNELQAIKLNKCNYVSVWELATGTITLSVSEEAKILIEYKDSVNFNNFKLENEISALDEI